MPAIARVISDPEERQPLIEAEAQRWGRADVENMLQHTPLIVLSVDGDPPNRPPATRSDHIALPEEVCARQVATHPSHRYPDSSAPSKSSRRRPMAAVSDQPYAVADWSAVSREPHPLSSSVMPASSGSARGFEARDCVSTAPLDAHDRARMRLGMRLPLPLGRRRPAREDRPAKCQPEGGCVGLLDDHLVSADAAALATPTVRRPLR